MMVYLDQFCIWCWAALTWMNYFDNIPSEVVIKLLMT